MVAEMVEVRGDIVGDTNVPDDESRERVFPAGAKTSRVERLCNLSIGLFGGEDADKFNDFGRSTNQVWSAQRQRPLQRGSGSPFPSNVDLDFDLLDQSNVFDQKP